MSGKKMEHKILFNSQMRENRLNQILCVLLFLSNRGSLFGVSRSQTDKMTSFLPVDLIFSQAHILLQEVQLDEHFCLTFPVKQQLLALCSSCSSSPFADLKITSEIKAFSYFYIFPNCDQNIYYFIFITNLFYTLENVTNRR